jgi:hypothetical protein
MGNLITPNELRDTFFELIPLNEPVFIWGSPGIGKSQIIHQVAEHLEMDMIDFRAVYRDPVDVRGYPSIDKTRRVVEWFLSSEFPTSPDAKAIFFLDELSQAPQLTQAALLQLVLDRRIADYVVPDGVVFIAASNRQQDKAGGHRIIPPLLDRFLTQYELETNAKDWHQWALNHGIHHFITSFIRFKPSMLNTFDSTKNELSFATPRSWEKLSKVLLGVSEPRWRGVFSGSVGEGVANEFLGFLECYQEIPTVEQIIANPNKAKVPTKLSARFAITGSLASHINCQKDRNKIKEAIIPILHYGTRLPEDSFVGMFYDIINRNKFLIGFDPIQKWIQNNQELCLALGGIINEAKGRTKE